MRGRAVYAGAPVCKRFAAVGPAMLSGMLNVYNHGGMWTLSYVAQLEAVLCVDLRRGFEGGPGFCPAGCRTLLRVCCMMLCWLADAVWFSQGHHMPQVTGEVATALSLG